MMKTKTMPLFNIGVKALPSKWEDAERWITSPSPSRASSLGQQQQVQVQRSLRPKSKSGPLVNNPGAVRLIESGNFAVGSPFSLGLMMFDDTVSIAEDGGARSRPMTRCSFEQSIARSASLPGLSDALPSSQTQEELGSTEDTETKLPKIVSRRDMGTQMSPNSSPYSLSPKERPHISPTSSSHYPMPESTAKIDRSSKSEVRDVEVDGRATIVRWSKKHGARRVERVSNKKSKTPIVENYFYTSAATTTRTSTNSTREGQASPLDREDGMSYISKYQREEAKISAWEELQKAKAETAIRELEVNLEKRRSSSMDKILKKLRVAQIKAQEMRRLIPEVVGKHQQLPKTSHKKAVASVFRNVQISVLSSCFTCHAL